MPGAWPSSGRCRCFRHIRKARMKGPGIEGLRTRGTRTPDRRNQGRLGAWGEVGRYPAPTRAAPLGGSNVPRVHAWTGREPTLRSGAVGVGVTSARRSGCRWRLFGADAGEQRGCGESRPRRSARIGAAGTLRNRIAVVATTEACRRLTPSARGAVDGSGGTSKRAAHAAGREGLWTETARWVRVTR
jgi:transposase